MTKDILRTVRTSKERMQRWEELSQELGVSKNHVFNLLIDGAEVVSKPRAKVLLTPNDDEVKPK